MNERGKPHAGRIGGLRRQNRSPRGIREGVIYVRDGKVAAVTREREAGARKSIDATGLYVLPGCVDGHVHMMDPGFTDREDFITGTAAAARGGTTTIIEHHRHAPPTLSAQILGRPIWAAARWWISR